MNLTGSELVQSIRPFAADSCLDEEPCSILRFLSGRLASHHGARIRDLDVDERHIVFLSLVREEAS